MRRAARPAVRGIALLLLASGPLGAQATATLSGTVFDSIAGVPLRGATVQVVAAHDSTRRATRATRADSAGAYRLDGLAPGRYYVGFHHWRLDALLLRERVRLVEVRAGEPAVADLAIPSSRSVVAALCLPMETDASGLVLGQVRDADGGAPLAGAEVAVMWIETRFDGGGREQVRTEQAVSTDADGRYALCGVPTDVPVAALARVGADASGLVPVPLEPRGLAVRDLTIGRGAAAALVPAGDSLHMPVRRGSAHLKGTVYFSTGAPYDGATVLLHGTAARDTTGRGGQFDFGSVPAGTQTLLVHAMGYEPRRVVVQLASGRTDSVRIVLGERTPVIERVTIAGDRPRSARDGFARRRSRGLGYSLDSAEIAALAPRSLADLLRAIPDVRIDLNLFDEAIRVNGCTPHVWLDGAYLRGGADVVSYIVDTRLLGGVELFTTLGRTPREFIRIGSGYTMGGDCGAVLVWTKEVLR